MLIDEIGSGTDPQEGSALARAVVAEFLATGPLLLATTHYSDVKAFAYETESVENASVEFDLQTLSPTYRLLIGIPGQSNALTIAGSLGLPAPILERAQSYLDPEELRSDRLLQDIQERRRAVEHEMERVTRDQAEVERLKRAAEEALGRGGTRTQDGVRRSVDRSRNVDVGNAAVGAADRTANAIGSAGNQA